ncbi:hypothetical protein CJ030_MR3G027892 [Morella rubra]|uniref:Uncharacterized protein n=1 Tax=Morella rubra TaxID=262757 RepID=A0A6A1W6B5_9ROSI|nr:hypothetical protein CJ030_MR3G027891 [Morella rubra]KAB1220793.1 hypothetical protein CJ030_MR3G027892 [Morella rubra]
MENGRRQSYSSMPLVSRLDHLDFTMKYLERKQSTPIWGSNSLGPAGVLQGQPLPMELAVKEAASKGSLLDRVSSLEHRLCQLCLSETHSSSTSSSSSRVSAQTLGDTCSGQGFKVGESSASLPAFNNPILLPDKLMSHETVKRLEIQGKRQRTLMKELKPASLPKQRRGSSGSNKDKKTCQNRKKGIAPNWPRLKLLGC